MSTAFSSAAARYDATLRGAHHRRLPPGYAKPQPTSAWPAENVELLERYYAWLVSGGTCVEATHQLYLPMAGHVLGLALKPHAQLDLDGDLDRAVDYVQAKRLSAAWLHNCRKALDKFRRFLRQVRGESTVSLRSPDPRRFCHGLPAWLVEQLERYGRVQSRNWRPARVDQQAMRFWGSHTSVWRWLFEHYAVSEISDIKRKYLFDYVDHQLAAGYATSSINHHLRCFRLTLLFLQEQEYRIPQALLRVPSLRQPDRLPRFLTDEQVRQVRDEIERRVIHARFDPHRREALLERAAFYLMWQGGLRLGEVEELHQEDLDLARRKLMVRQGKGRKDRTVYLTDTAIRALHDYLAVRGLGPTDHVFLYRNLAVHKDLLAARVRAAGVRAGVKVSPHALRHTCATQLLNAGCRVTSIQRLLGHRQIETTLIYARVHDRTVAADYYAAMANIEQALALGPDAKEVERPLSGETRAGLLELIDQLAAPQLGMATRLNVVEQMRCMLTGTAPRPVAFTTAAQLACSAYGSAGESLRSCGCPG